MSEAVNIPEQTGWRWRVEFYNSSGCGQYLYYTDEEKARETYNRLCACAADATKFRNDSEPFIEITDDMGVSTYQIMYIAHVRMNDMFEINKQHLLQRVWSETASPQKDPNHV